MRGLRSGLESTVGGWFKDIAKLDADYLGWIFYGDFTEQVKQAVRDGRSS